MVCSGCGAAYDDKEYGCPYCGKENEKMTVVRQHEQIERIYVNTNDKVAAPMKRANKVSAKFAIIVGALLLLVAIGTVIGVVMHGPMSMNNYEKGLADAEKLEELFDKRDYEAMDKMLDKVADPYASRYNKYHKAININSDIEYCIKQTEYVKHNLKTKERGVNDIKFDLYFLYEALEEIKEFESENYAKDEKEYVESCRKTVLDIFNNTYKLTKEEVEEWRADIRDKDEVDDYIEMAGVCYDRMTAEN